jgi:isopenicillin N synthase-like dioxygenase
MAGLVPVIDITAADAPEGLDAACRSIGFMSIVGHGIASDVIEAMVEATDEFFALPLGEKLRYRPPGAHIDRGYAAKGTESLAYSLGVGDRPPDLFEAFNIGPETRPAVIRAERPEFAPNIWPERPARLRETLMPYFDAAGGLARRVASVMAVALGLAPAFFDDKTDHSTDTLRVNHYERAPGEPEPVPGQQRMGAHTDYGILTVLYADQVPGLEVVGPDGAWHAVVPPEGALLVNLGDLLAEWTNDRWRSTLHRVVPPPRGADGPSVRRSMAFFHDGNYDAVIECLPTCCSADNPPRYARVTAGEHLMAKLLAPRTLTPSEALSTAGDRVDAINRPP